MNFQKIPNTKYQIPNALQRILVTGGAGYVGAVLVPKLLARGYHVTVLDWYLYGTPQEVFGSWHDHAGLTNIKADLRGRAAVKKALQGVDAVIHLACISNDPSYELNPDLGKSINYDATIQLVDLSRSLGIRRFIYASSSSVYGVKNEPEVTEELSLEPLTDYSKYKAMCEPYVLGSQKLKVKSLPAQAGQKHNSKVKSGNEQFVSVVLRPATVCGYSPRLRLDLTVNILTLQGLVNKKITVFGGGQKRPNIHIEDMTDAYCAMLEYPEEKISGKIFNVGYDNMTVGDIAGLVKTVIGDPSIEIITTPTNDNRSYHVSSKKIETELGFKAMRSVEDAIVDLVRAYREGKIIHPFTDPRFFNIKMMQQAEIQ